MTFEDCTSCDAIEEKIFELRKKIFSLSCWKQSMSGGHCCSACCFLSNESLWGPLGLVLVLTEGSERRHRATSVNVSVMTHQMGLATSLSLS